MAPLSGLGLGRPGAAGLLLPPVPRSKLTEAAVKAGPSSLSRLPGNQPLPLQVYEAAVATPVTRLVLIVHGIGQTLSASNIAQDAANFKAVLRQVEQQAAAEATAQPAPAPAPAPAAAAAGDGGTAGSGAAATAGGTAPAATGAPAASASAASVWCRVDLQTSVEKGLYALFASSEDFWLAQETGFAWCGRVGRMQRRGPSAGTVSSPTRAAPSKRC